MDDNHYQNSKNGAKTEEAAMQNNVGTNDVDKTDQEQTKLESSFSKLEENNLILRNLKELSRRECGTMPLKKKPLIGSMRT